MSVNLRAPEFSSRRSMERAYSLFSGLVVINTIEGAISIVRYASSRCRDCGSNHWRSSAVITGLFPDEVRSIN